MILPMFFALSGFLVASSLERLGKIGPFLWNRVLRIFPALVVEITLSAFILGPLLTQESLSSYFSSREFFTYLLNCAGWVHLYLPGVFVSNPWALVVNASLWTVPYELECYVALSVIFIISTIIKKYKIILVASFIILSYFIIGPNQGGLTVPNLSGRELVVFFLAGNMVFVFGKYLRHSIFIAAASFLIGFWISQFSGMAVLAALPVAYVAAYLGCTNPPKSRIIRSGDYSYGIYLYAFPMQQTVIFLLGPDQPLLTFALALSAAVIFSIFSWHAIEKHALKLKSLVLRERPAPALV